MSGVATTFDLGDLKSSLEPSGMPQTVADTAVYLGSITRRRFMTSTDPGGNPWPELKRPRNRKRDKAAKGGSGQKPLWDTATLMNSASGQEGATDSVSRTTAWSVEQGTNLDYAAVHNFGHTFHRTTCFGKPTRPYDQVIPQREFIGITEQDADRIAEIAADNLAEGTP